MKRKEIIQWILAVARAGIHDDDWFDALWDKLYSHIPK